MQTKYISVVTSTAQEWTAHAVLERQEKSSENGDSEGLQEKIPRGYKPPIATTHDEVMEEYHNMQAEWIKTKDTSALLHHQFMTDLIEHIEQKQGCSKETAQKYLYHQEASRAGHENKVSI